MHEQLVTDLRESSTWNPSVVCRRYARQAADVIEAVCKDLKDCRNELCYKCGKYKERHLGACDGCRWKEME